MDKELLIQLTKRIYRLTLLFPKKEPLRYKMREKADEILADSLKLYTPNPSNPPSVRRPSEAEPPHQILVWGAEPSEGREIPSTKIWCGGSEPLSIFENLEILDCFFEVAKEQNWVKSADILAIQKEYANLRERLERKKLEDSLGDKDKSSHFTVAQRSEIGQPLISTEIPAKMVSEEFKMNLIPLNNEKDNEKINERQEKILTFLKEQGRAQVWQIKQILPEVTKRTLRRDFGNLLKKGLIERVGERNNTFYQIKKEQA